MKASRIRDAALLLIAQLFFCYVALLLSALFLKRDMGIDHWSFKDAWYVLIGGYNYLYVQIALILCYVMLVVTYLYKWPRVVGIFLLPLVFWVIYAIATWYIQEGAPRHLLAPVKVLHGFKDGSLDIHYLWWFISGAFVFLSFGSMVGMTNRAATGRQGKYGDAHYADNGEIKKLKLNYKKGMVLCKRNGSLVRADKPLSVLLLAPPGTGKTAGFITANMWHLPHSLVVFDKKGEIYNVTHQHRKRELNNDILVFDPTQDDSATFNPLADNMAPIDDLRALKRHIKNLASVLFPTEGKGDFFPQQARNLFTLFAIVAFKVRADAKEISIPKVKRDIFAGSNLEKTIKQLVKDHSTDTTVTELGNMVLSNASGDDQWAGVVATVANGLSVFDDEYVAAATEGESDINTTVLRQNPTTIYLMVREKDHELLAPLMNLLFQTLGKGLISELPTPEDQQVTFVLDEFARIGRMDSLVQLPAVGRGYKANIFFVAQDYGQIERIYDRHIVSEMETNCEYKIIYRQNNFDTAKKISEYVGKETMMRVSTSKNKNKSGKNTSESESEEGISLLFAQDILEMPAGECLVIAGGGAARPIKGEIPYVLDEQKYTKLQSGNDA